MRLPIWAWLIVDALCVYRITRLIGVDTITAPARERVRAAGWHKNGHPKPKGAHARLTFTWATCAWCTSIWVAVGVVIFTRLWPLGWSYVALALAFSVVAGLLSMVGD